MWGRKERTWLREGVEGTTSWVLAQYLTEGLKKTLDLVELMARGGAVFEGFGGRHGSHGGDDFFLLSQSEGGFFRSKRAERNSEGGRGGKTDMEGSRGKRRRGTKKKREDVS